MNIERSPTKSAPKNFYQHPEARGTFQMDGFFPQSIMENSVFPKETITPERCPFDSFDSVDGRVNDSFYRTANEGRRYIADGEKLANSNSSDEGKGFKVDGARALRYREPETRFSSSSESERRFSSSPEKINDSNHDDKQRSKHAVKIKISKQKQLNENNEPDSDTRIYGKSPKFDDNFTSFQSVSEQMNDRRSLNLRDVESGRKYHGEDVEEDVLRARDGVVFNTLEGFGNEDIENMNLEPITPFYFLENTDEKCINNERSKVHDYLRKSEERKFSAGQIKRPLSQDEDVSTKSGRVLESPEVTPSEVGRMLNLGNVLDGPRQIQANKYLSMVTLHLPVILRLSVNCPFRNVRIKCAEILEMVKVRIIYYNFYKVINFFCLKFLGKLSIIMLK